MLMALSLVACGKGGQSSGWLLPNGDNEKTVDLGGYEFFVSDYYSTRWAPPAGETPQFDETLRIVEEVETLYNCKITHVEQNVSELISKVQPEVMAGNKYVDLIITTMWNHGKLIGSNVLGDLQDLTTVNWENPWWNQNLMRAATVNGRVLAGACPFTSHTYLTWSCYFNKQIWDELGYEDPYELVRQGKWTYPRFIEFAKGAMLDRDGNGIVDSFDDRWGMVGPVDDYCRGVFIANGAHFYQTNDMGQVELASDTPHAIDVVAMLRKMIREDKIHDTKLNGKGAFTDIIGSFIDNHSLFIVCSPGEGALREMGADFGFLPQPKFDDAQENYSGGVDHNAPLFGIPSPLAANKSEMDSVGYIMEALARRFHAVEVLQMDDWRDTLWRDDDSDEMMRNYVYGRGGYDLALIAKDVNGPLGRPIWLMRDAVYGSVVDYASAIEAEADVIRREMAKFGKFDDQ